MSKARIVVLIVAAALAYVVLTSRTADGDKREPDRGQIEEIKGEREENGKSERRKARHARIFHGLDLTEDQKQQMNEIRRQFREDMRALHMAHKRNMMSVLTPSQQDTLQMRMERIKRYRENNRPKEREDHMRDSWPEHWRGDFPEPKEAEGTSAAKFAETAPVALQNDPTTWGKVKNLFE